MTARLAVVASECVSRRALVLAALIATLIGAWVAQRLHDAERGGAAAPPAVTRLGASNAGLATLSAQSRAALSAAVGAKDRAYDIHGSGSGLSAGNPSQHLAITFARRGVVIAADQLRLGLRLAAIGTGDALSPVAAAAPTAGGNRVAYAHAGVGEWYVNGTLGLEQGFTVARAPAAGTALTLQIDVTGNTRAALGPGGRSATFVGAGGESLEYGGLSASDARGRALRSSLALRGDELLLQIDTRGARFPLQIDPLIEQQPELKLVATLGEKGENSHYGRSVALSADGDTALVGAPGGHLAEGAAWIFRRSGSTWIQQGTKLEVPAADEPTECAEEDEVRGEDPEECGFGWSVALSADGSTALLGDPRAELEEGAAWVFTRSGETWSRSARLAPPGVGLSGRFGRSVALSASGQTALVGAPAAGGGRAWAFARAGSSWTEMGGALTGREESGEARFGRSVALSGSGETALIGGPADDDGAGAAWAFERAGDSWLSEGSKLTAAGESGEGLFGFDVALSGDGAEAVVGAYGDHDDRGGAWMFAQSGSGFAQQGPELTSGDEAEDMFGYGVAISPDGDSALIGAPHADEGRGAAWLYERGGTSWTAAKELVGAGEETGRGHFGTSVALTAAVGPLLVGGPSEGGNAGAAWLFGLAPAVSGLAPQNGAEAGGTTVTISGEHLSGATAVRFGTSDAAGFTVESDGSITAITPPGSGEVDVTVETALGTSATNAHDVFTYKEGHSLGTGPAVSGLAPQNGAEAGGTTVTISGEHLSGAMAVRFGSSGAAGFTVESDGSITAITPPGSGEVDVTVETPLGTSATSARDVFTYKEKRGRGAATSKAADEEPPAAGVLASGPSSTVSATGALAGCGLALRSKRISVQRHSRALFKLVGTGVGHCSGKLRLRVRTKLANRRLGTKTIGTAVFSVVAGARISVGLHLNAIGRAMLATRHGRLNASLLIVRSLPIPLQAHTASVRLKLQSPATRT